MHLKRSSREKLSFMSFAAFGKKMEWKRLLEKGAYIQDVDKLGRPVSVHRALKLKDVYDIMVFKIRQLHKLQEKANLEQEAQNAPSQTSEVETEVDTEQERPISIVQTTPQS
jgi:hypothetical protein